MAIIRPTPVPTPKPPAPRQQSIGGRTYSTNFIGPIRPQDRRAPPGFIGPTYTGGGAPTAPKQSVLGLNTTRGLGVQPSSPSPSPTSSYNLLEPIPEQPAFDETPFNDIIGQIDQLGNVFRSDYDTASKGIQTRSASELSGLEQQKTEGEQNLQQYKTQAEQDTQANVEEQRRQFAEVQQGLQARFGQTTGTGAFVSELAGRETLRNIGGFKQTLQNEFSKVNQIQNNLLRSYMQQKQDITSRTEQLLSEARNQLNRELGELQLRKGQVTADKIARRDQALQNYRSLVSDVQARNTAYLREVDQRKSQLQNQLQGQTYKMTYNAMQKALGFYEEMATRGGLTEQGLRAAEQAYGLTPGTLQAPTGIGSTGGGTITSRRKKLQSIAGLPEEE